MLNIFKKLFEGIPACLLTILWIYGAAVLIEILEANPTPVYMIFAFTGLYCIGFLKTIESTMASISRIMKMRKLS